MRLLLQHIYVIDVPRGFNQKKMDGMWAAIETVKNGYAYDGQQQPFRCYTTHLALLSFFNSFLNFITMSARLILLAFNAVE